MLVPGQESAYMPFVKIDDGLFCWTSLNIVYVIFVSGTPLSFDLLRVFKYIIDSCS